MANKGTINEIVDRASYAQLDKLIKLLVNIRGELVGVSSEIKDMNDAISKSKSIKEFEAATLKVNQALKDMATIAERTQKAAVDAEVQKQKAVDASIKKYEQEGKAYIAAKQAEASRNKTANESIQIIKNQSAELTNVTKKIVEQKTQLDSLSVQEKQLNSDYKDGIITLDQYSDQLGAINSQQLKLRKSTQDLATTATQLTRVEQAENGSYDQKTAKLDKLRRQYKSLTDEERRNVDVGGVLLKNIQGIDKELKEVDETLGVHTRHVGNYERALGVLGPVISAALGFFAVDKIIDFGKKIFDVTAEFQKLEAVLTNTLGSKSLARKALSDIQEFAAKTPFGVQELTESYVKLANQGFKPTVNQLRQLGDLASSTGKSFDQLSEAIIDAQTGEFERLKEFGIRASKEGDKVTFTFKGVKKQVDFTSSSIRDYITSLGDLEGVSGSMAAISKTLGGQVSNLGDSFDKLFKTIGDQGDGIFSSALGAFSKFIDILQKGLRSEQQIIDDNTDKYISAQAEKVEKGVQAEIYALVKAGAKRSEAELKIFEKQRDKADELARQIAENNLITEKQITDDSLRLSQMRNEGKFGIEEKALAQSIATDKKTLRLFKANYDTQIFLRDDYNQRIVALNQKGQQDADAAAAALAKTAKDRAKRLKEELDEQYNLQKQRLEFQRDAAKDEQNDNTNNTDTRLVQQKTASVRELDLLDLTLKYQQNQIGVSNTQKLILQEKYNHDVEALEKKGANDRSKIVIEGLDKEVSDLNAALDKKAAAAAKSAQVQLNELSILRDNEIAALNTKDRNYEKNRAAIQDRYLKLQLQKEINNTQDIIDLNKTAVTEIEAEELKLYQYRKMLGNATTEDEKKQIEKQITDLETKLAAQKANLKENSSLEAQLAALRAQLNGQAATDEEKSLAEKQAKIQSIVQYTSQISQAAFGLLQARSDAYYQTQVNAINAAATANQDRYDKEKAAIEASSLTEEQKKVKLALLDKKKEAQDKEIADRQRREDLAKARRDRAIAVVQIVAQTALAVVHQLGSGDPYTAFARAAAVAVVGALQLATALAQPIPAYEKGGTKQGDGPAIVGEKGREMIVSPDGSMHLSDSVPSLEYLKHGTKVITHPETERLLANGTLSHHFHGEGMNVDKIINSDRQNTDKIVRSMKGKRTPIEKTYGNLKVYKTSA